MSDSNCNNVMCWESRRRLGFKLSHEKYVDKRGVDIGDFGELSCSGEVCPTKMNEVIWLYFEWGFVLE